MVSKSIMQRLEQGYCFHPDASSRVCSKTISSAHSIQKRGGLNLIAHDGHVYTFFKGYGKPSGWIGDPKLIGVQDASTFRGFCSHHDNETFAPIEKHPFQESANHAFLLGYRALCYQLYDKQVALDIYAILQEKVDGGLPCLEQENRQRFLLGLKESSANYENMLKYYKTLYDKALQTHDFSQVSYYTIHMANTPEFLGSGVLFPTCDFSGNIIQNKNPGKGLSEHITFSLIPTDKGGAAVFSWLGKSSAAEHLIRSLNALSILDLPHALVRYTFEIIQNKYMSPQWWDALGIDEKLQLRARVLRGVGLLGLNCPVDCLLDDGLRVVNWTITSRRTN